MTLFQVEGDKIICKDLRHFCGSKLSHLETLEISVIKRWSGSGRKIRTFGTIRSVNISNTITNTSILRPNVQQAERPISCSLEVLESWRAAFDLAALHAYRKHF